MFGLIRRNRRPTVLRHLVSAIQREVPANLGQTAVSSNDANLDLPGRYRLNNRRAGLFFKADANTGMFTQEITQIFW